jgi:hypothetical protein
MLKHKIVDGFTVQERIEKLSIPDARKEYLTIWVSARTPDDEKFA